MKRTIIYTQIICLLAAPLFTLGQNKPLSQEQLFQGKYPNIYNQLPDIEGWADDEHYILARETDGRAALVKVHAVTGKESPYTKDEPAVPVISGAKNVTLSPDGRHAAYTKDDHNLYVMELAGRQETALTSDGSASILNGYASWIYYEEILGRASRYKAFWWAPDSRQLAFMRFDDAAVPVFPIYVADGTHGYLEETHYPKAGDPNPQVKIGIVPLDTKKTVWADFDPVIDQYFGTPAWTPGNELFVQWMNRHQDSLVIFKINGADGKKTKVYEEMQSTWITLDDADRISFLENGKGFIVKSDKDGWENLYLFDMNGKPLNQITRGNNWGTSILLLDEKKGQVYIRARKEQSTRFDIYRVPLNGKGASARLSPDGFTYDDVHISPGGKYFISAYSNLAAPPVYAVFDGKGKTVREIGNGKGHEFGQYFVPQTRLVRVPTADGQFELPLTITYPANFDSTKKYPVWISVYGGPNAGSVYDRWKYATAVQQHFAQQGVVQISMDNRSSGHFGKKGMNYIFRKLGKYEIEDFMDCGRWIRSQRWADTGKIGITGGSFGGYITCMALTYGADVFTHGIALYSVTDWHFYDSHYTERFMNKPEENAEGYSITSALTYANKYRGVLRIVHGTTDDNVHMQNSIRLIDTLQNLNKPFELMLYPNQRHGVGMPKARHLQMETIRFVEKYLLGK